MSWDGILLIDKPKDWTSHDVVAKVRRLLSLSAVGHSGTLDPFASGLLVLLLGHGTKISDFILSEDKSYEVTVRLGLRTDTLDRTGKVLTESEVGVEPAEIKAVLERCQGEVELDVPSFSAVKVKGKKLYEYARAGQEVQRPKKLMKFYNVELLEATPSSFTARLSCSKGTYIRAWASWVGDELGVGATTEELRRLASKPFHVENAVTVGELEAICLDSAAENSAAENSAAENSAEDKAEDKAEGSQAREKLGAAFLPLVEALPNIPRLTISSRDERLLLNGQISRDLTARLIGEQKESLREDRIVPIKVISGSSGRLLSLLEAQPGKGLKIRRIFKA